MIDNRNIDIFYDLVDEACLLLYEELHLDYLECLIRVGNDLLNDVNEEGCSDEVFIKLQNIYQKITDIHFVNEEIRQALELLIIKGFKHNGLYPLDLMTPDSVCYLFVFMINHLLDNNATIIDVQLGTGNLLNAIANYLSNECKLIGIEKDARLSQIAKVSSDLQNNQMTIYLNDCLTPIGEVADIIVGDLDPQFNGSYLPYSVINKFMDNLYDNGFFLYLIPNDFFNQKGIEAFKQQFKGTFLGLVVLPSSMFRSNCVGKSILIGTKRQIDKLEMLVINIPTMVEQEKIKSTINYIGDWIKNLKGMIV